MNLPYIWCADRSEGPTPRAPRDIFGQMNSSPGTPCPIGQGASPGAAIGFPACTASEGFLIMVNNLLIHLAGNIPAGGIKSVEIPSNVA